MAKQDLTLHLKARDSASAKIKGLNQQARKLAMDVVGPFLAVGAAISMASKAGAAAVMLSAANGQRAAAMQERSATGMLEAQIKVNEALSEFGGAIPVIGESIKKAMLSWADNEGIKRAIQNIKEIEAATKKYHEMNVKMAQESALARARVAGASAADIAAMREGWRKDQTEKDIEAVRETEAKALKDAQAAAIQLGRARQSASSDVGTAEFGVWQEVDVENHPRVVSAREVEEAARQAYEDARGKRERMEREAAERSASAAAENAQQAADIRIAAEKTVTKFLEDDTARRIRLINEEADAAKTAAQRSGGGQDSQIEAERARRTAEVHDQEAAAFQKTIDDKKTKQDAANMARLADKQRFEDMAFNATHSAHARELRELDQWHAAQQAKYAGDAEMLAHIDAAAAAKHKKLTDRDQADQEAKAQDRAAAQRQKGMGIIAKLREGARAAAGGVQAVNTRFGGRGADTPTWATRLTGATDKQTATLAEKLGELPDALAAKLVARFATASFN